MTGMGRDGVEGCKAILAAEGFTLGQDEGTSVVYGMNKAAFLEGAVKAQFALDELPHVIQNIVALRAELESPLTLGLISQAISYKPVRHTGLLRCNS